MFNTHQEDKQINYVQVLCSRSCKPGMTRATDSESAGLGGIILIEPLGNALKFELHDVQSSEAA